MEKVSPESLTLHSFIEAFYFLKNETIEIKRLLLDQNIQVPHDPDQWFNLTQFCNYHPDKPTKPTVYGWIQSGEIPYHKGAKKLRFLKSEIDEWLKSGRRKTTQELQREAASYITNTKKKSL